MEISEIEELTTVVLASFHEVQELDVTSKAIMLKFLEKAESAPAIQIQALLDYMHEKINIGNWKEVKPFLRKAITIASFIKLLVHLKLSDKVSDEILKESFKIIDFGLMFGCPLDTEPKLLQKCASFLQPKSINTELKCSKSIDKTTPSQSISCSNTITVISCPSMELFYKNYILTETPVVLENCMNHWPALNKWNDENYFIKLAGYRTVAIELGSKYTDKEWTQKLMTIEEFIKHHIYEVNGPTGYLAQYQLFDQIPKLKEDIYEPEYCCFADSNEPVDINAWYGPKGTVSPLHHDPKRNLLAQVVGEKQLYLFPPSDSEYLYPHEHELLNNTAQVDPRNPDYEKYPKYKEAKAHYCVLKPGQMLYIPPKWWHFVESLSISFSVSFWWE